LNDEQGLEIIRRIKKYVDESCNINRFDIGEATGTFGNKSKDESKGTDTLQILSKSVPFIKGLQIGTEIRVEKDETSNHDTELQVDYWVPIIEKKKEEQNSVKASFQFVAITRLPAIAHQFRCEHKPTASTLAMLLQFRDKKAKKVFGIANKGGGKLHSVNESIVKLTCSAAHDDTFRVVIDGVEWAGAKIISVSPQWSSHVKFFPVAKFEKDSLNYST